MKWKLFTNLSTYHVIDNENVIKITIRGVFILHLYLAVKYMVCMTICVSLPLISVVEILACIKPDFPM